VTYACVEERGVGWEPREGQQDAIGQFAPSASAKLMKFTPPEIADGKMVRLGELVVTEDGNSYSYSSNECANLFSFAVQDRAFGATDELDYYLKLCAGRFAADAPMRSVGYGIDMVRYYFTADPATRQSPISYSLSMMVGIAMAYSSRGTCTLVQ
jgi:hypothetical protein